MSNTVSDVLNAFAYYIGHGGYYEKANGAAKYLTNSIENFSANKGSGNYTYMGKLCGINPGAWCAMMVSTAVYEGCGSDRSAAKKALWGVWPYAVCSSLWNAAPSSAKHWSWYQIRYKGRSGAAYTPKVGDVIEFTDNTNITSHTGMVYAVDSDYVYTYEGNSANMARKRSYSLKSSYIWGYVTLNLDGASESEDVETAKNVKTFQKWLGVESDGKYGANTKKAAIKAHQRYLNSKYNAGLSVDGVWGPATYYATEKVQKGDENNDVLVWQGVLYCLGYDPVGMDGLFGSNTEKATEALQIKLGLNATGIADRYTWAKAFGYSRPAHSTLKFGSAGPEVKYLQRKLTDAGFSTSTDGRFGKKTEESVINFQKENGLEDDGIVGAKTWSALE